MAWHVDLRAQQGCAETISANVLKRLDAMFVDILLRDLARDFGVEFESLRHIEIFEISARADEKL